MRLVAILCLVLLVAGTARAQTLGPSGNPLPRYASVKGSTVNVRTGPGMGFPIRWVITTRRVPLRIVEESGDWRRVEDVDDELGWVHTSLLSGKRSALVISDPTTQALRRRPSPDARTVLLAEPGTFGWLETCEADWCQLTFDDTKGWMRKTALWGVEER